MRLNFEFTNLLSSGTAGQVVLFYQDILICANGTRVTEYDLRNSQSFTYSFEHESTIRSMSCSSDGFLLISIDDQGRSIITDRKRRFTMQYFTFNKSVYRNIVKIFKFSHNSYLIAISMDKYLQVWRFDMSDYLSFSPLELLWTFSGHRDIISSLDWHYPYIITGSEDMTGRVFKLVPKDQNKGEKEGYQEEWNPIILSNHGFPIVGSFFNMNDESIFTIGKNGSLICRKFSIEQGKVLGLEKDEFYKFNLELEGRITSTFWSSEHSLLLAGFDSGCFGLYRIAYGDCQQIHALTVGQHPLTSVVINDSGDWLALGSNEHLIVWEWKSESFILQQQKSLTSTGKVAAWSPDGFLIATGNDLGEVRIWRSDSGFVIHTFKEHKGSITGLGFTLLKNILFSASSDGTIKAYDMERMKPFRTFTTPTPTSISCIAVDPSGDLIIAGTMDYGIYIWSVMTGSLLEIISGHTAPISSISFNPNGGNVLASASWDGTVRLWNIWARDKNCQILRHSTECLSIAWHPEGKELAVATLDSSLTFWDTDQIISTAVIETRRDVADKPLNGAYLNSLAYSGDGTKILVGGTFSFAAIYGITGRLLLRRYPLSSILMSHDKKVIMRKKENDTNGAESFSENTVFSLGFNPTGQSWFAMTERGLLIFSIKSTIMFDAFDLDIQITPDRVLEMLHSDDKNYLLALIMSLKLGEHDLIKQVWLSIPIKECEIFSRNIPFNYLSKIFAFLRSLMIAPNRDQNIELICRWINIILLTHGLTLKEKKHPEISESLISIHRDLKILNRKLNDMVEECKMRIKFIQNAPLNLIATVSRP